MSNCTKHEDHPHKHGENCGHTKIKHDDHYDFLHDGHMHHPHEDHIDEHVLEVNDKNPAVCNSKFNCEEHVHGPNCGHEAVPHGDHTCYVVDGRLHHYHNGHCDDHGPVELVANG